MSIVSLINKRAENKCELCSSPNELKVYLLKQNEEEALSNSILICANCNAHIDNLDSADINYWRCLSDSMWSQYRPVQAMVWRLLNRYRNEGWTEDLLAMMYLDEETLLLAKACDKDSDSSKQLVHRDVNGVQLYAGDSVVLIKDLKVKGSSMVAKQGTAVRRISLDYDNEKYIEGKINGQQIVIITDYVKRI